MLEISAISLLILLFLGVPVSFAIGLSGLLAILFGSEIPGFMAVQQLVRGLNSTTMMAAPLFILAGEILSGAKLSQRILNFCRSLVSWATGSLGIVCVLANMIFAGISGSGAATMSAIGSITAPELKKAGYSKAFTAAIIAGGGALGPIIPPSINMIVFASLTGFSVGKIFLGGIIPGVIIGFCLIIMCNIYARKNKIDQGSKGFIFKDVLKYFREAFFALMTPIIIIAGVTGGVFTATESGIIACLYGLFCGFFIYKTLKIKDLVHIFKKASESSAMLLMIMGIANIYSYIFAIENVGVTIRDIILQVSQNPYVVVSIIILAMLIIGCFMETIAAMVVILPVVYPIVLDLGFDPLVFGVLFSIATIIGGLTPPFGLYLFLSMSITEASFKDAIKYIFHVVFIIIITMMLTMVFPDIITFLPNILIK